MFGVFRVGTKALADNRCEPNNRGMREMGIRHPKGDYFMRKIRGIGLILCGVALFCIGLAAGRRSEEAYSPEHSGSAAPLALPLASAMPPLDARADELFGYSYTYYDYDTDKGYSDAPSFVKEPVLLSPERTAFIIIDPWVDNPSEAINRKGSEVVGDYILPLAERFASCGARIIIATNAYIYEPSRIDPRLQALVDAGQAERIFHQDYDTSEKVDALLSGVDALVYSGFSTNMCVLFRPLGIMPMHYARPAEPYALYVVPEATAAFAFTTAADNLRLRDDTLITLAQNRITLLLQYEDLAAYLAQLP